jgi:recombination protein RecT
MSSTPPTTPSTPGKELSRPQQQRLTLRRLFENQKQELVNLLPRGMDPDRLYRMALTECVKNPKLLECSAESWALAMQTCAAQGLYPDSALGYMYLIPSNNSKNVGGKWIKVMEVRAQRGYQGDIKLARNTGEIAKIGAEVVYARDHYKVTKGLDPNIEHVPYDGDDDPGALRACYAFAKILSSGEIVFVALTKRDVMRHKAASQGADGEDSPWKKHEAAMWRKSAIRELFKWLPKDSDKAEQVARALSTDAVGAIETTALDLGNVTLPGAGETSSAGLDHVADRLESQAAATTTSASTPIEGATCPDHPTQTIVNGDSSRACFADGCKWTAPAPREPGSDDDAPTEAEAVRDVKALADKAGDPTKARARQGRLQE